MIRPEQLADALQRLEPRDRELLSLSLHRRVPDEALARMYDYEPAEVSRRRAAAIERLADDLRVQRGEDLGSVLKALLEPGTWAGIEPAPGREFTVPDARPPTPEAVEPPPPAPERDRRAQRDRRAPRALRRPTPIAAEAASAPEPLPAPVPLRPVPRPEPEPEKAPEPPPATLVGGGGPAEGATSRRAGAGHARRGTQGRRGTRAPGSHGLPHARGAGRRRIGRRCRPDGRHPARRQRLRERAQSRAATTARATSCRPRAGRSRRRSRPIRAPRPVTRPPTWRSPRSCSGSRAASRACGSPSAPSGGRRECSAWSASAATGSGCRPRSSRTERWPGYPASARVWTACAGRSTPTSPSASCSSAGTGTPSRSSTSRSARRATPRRSGGSRSPTSSR